VSVIVPIYNVEKYLRKCVDSLLSQTLKEIEIVLVDDGSPDASGEIADEYQKKYSNVKTIHRENGGLGPARNTGIENATGEYVAFLDSDDWVESDMYEKLYLVASKENADIVVSGHCDFANDKAMVK
ncbi:TPA: glycosyltransferase family 2 protein, partial [Enterococcus faecium]